MYQTLSDRWWTLPTDGYVVDVMRSNRASWKWSSKSSPGELLANLDPEEMKRLLSPVQMLDTLSLTPDDSAQDQ